MSPRFDVIVVGAGPGGSNAAAVALRAGLEVAQVERHRFPRVKPCAGGLTPKACDALAIDLDLRNRRTFEDFEVNLWGGRRSRLTHRRPLLHTVMRPELDNDLVERNRERPGFHFFDGERVREIHHDGHVFRVRTDERTLESPQLVGADGANGIVNRTFPISRPKARAIAVEIVLHRDRARLASPVPPCFDFGAVADGYGWVFPKHDNWSVGLYSLSHGHKDLRERLARYVTDKGFVVDGDPLENMEAHPIPVGGYRLRVPDVPVYLVGDAGGFADALTGEGIYHALESGRLAGETLRDATPGRADHRRYYRRLRRGVLLDTFLSYHLARLFYRDVDRGLRLLRKRFVWGPLVHGHARGASLARCIALGGGYLIGSFLGGKSRLQTDPDPPTGDHDPWSVDHEPPPRHPNAR